MLVRQLEDGTCYRGTIVETEAYAPGDPACHAYKRQTPRNRAMFKAAGHMYVYLIYGMYHCLNIVTDAAGVGSAVLVRAVALDRLPPREIDQKKINQKQRQLHRVAAGPGLLCRVLHIDRRHDGLPLVAQSQSPLWLDFPEQGLSPEDLVQTTRIGLTQGADIPWRWYWRNHPAVSKR